MSSKLLVASLPLVVAACGGEPKGGHVMLSKETESHPRLFVSTAGKAPPGCAPAAADKTLITVSDVPPFSQ